MPSKFRQDFSTFAVRATMSALTLGFAMGDMAAAQASAHDAANHLSQPQAMTAEAPTAPPAGNPLSIFIGIGKILAGAQTDRDRVAQTKVNVQAQNAAGGGNITRPDKPPRQA